MHCWGPCLKNTIKYNTFTLIPNSLANSRGALLARGHVWPERPPAARWTTSDFLQLKTVFPSTRNDMFWKNLAFRLDETPTSELGFSGHKHGRPRKTSKTQGFSTIYLAGRNSCHHLGPPATATATSQPRQWPQLRPQPRPSHEHNQLPPRQKSQEKSRFSNALVHRPANLKAARKHTETSYAFKTQ